MPAKKNTKKTATKTAGKAKKKVASKKKTPAKVKTAPKGKKVAEGKAPIKAVLKTDKAIKSVDSPKKEMVECSHCLGAGKCTTGNIFDKDRHQSLFQEQLLTSCFDCLAAAGKSRNSKKLVACRICQGTGEVEKG